jgi:hypothetical protein
LAVVLIVSCKDQKAVDNTVLIDSAVEQKKIFDNLVSVTGAVMRSTCSDSLSFLVLPVEASCPSCRNKTIDYIVKFKSSLPENHFIIISANGGLKTINSFFRERQKTLPDMKDRLFLDSSNQALKYNLYEEQPTFYYTAGCRAYKKVIALPSTVKRNLNDFFQAEKVQKPEKAIVSKK